MSNDNIASLRNYFNNLINQQIEQNNFDQNRSKKFNENTEQNSNTQNAPETDSSVLNNLSDLLGAAQNDSTDSKFILSIYKLVQFGANVENIVNLLASLANDTGDLLYTRTGGDDPNLNIQNRIKYLGGDLEDFINQATRIAQEGKDINRYIDSASTVFNNGDYDDLRRFISVTDSVLNRKDNLNKFFEYSDKVTNNQINDMEVNLYSLQVMIDYGATLDTALSVMNNMVTNEMQGRRNMAELTAITFEAKKAGCYLPDFYKQMADSGDSKVFMDKWLADRGMKMISLLDNKKYERIEGIDNKKDMVIHQGEKAALCAQALSSTDGILPASYLYWSSTQTGAMTKGSNYLDLSRLKEGVYDIYVKVAGYAGGTDTAKRRVVVLAKEGHDNNGLGDTKDDDNTEKGIDESNPGHDEEFYEDYTEEYSEELTAEDIKQRKLEFFRRLCRDVMQNPDPSFYDNSSNIEHFVELMNRINSEEGKDDSWSERLMEMEKDHAQYTETINQIRKQIAKETEDKKLSNQKIAKDEEDRKKDFKDYLFKLEIVKNNNGLGDTKDSDNVIKGIDDSNPGKKQHEILPVISPEIPKVKYESNTKIKENIKII